MMKKNRKVGDTYRPVVTVVKLKHGEPSVVEISGNRYILRNEKEEMEEKK